MTRIWNQTTPFWEEFEKGVDYYKIVTPFIPLFDWDAADSASHHRKCITFSTKEDILTFVEKKASEEGFLFSLWKTKGGVHGILLNKQIPCIKSYKVHKPYLVDPIYQIYTINRGYVLRCSPKKNRPEGRPVHFGIVGKGFPLPENLALEEKRKEMLDKYFI